jgi:hypothetical protein
MSVEAPPAAPAPVAPPALEPIPARSPRLRWDHPARLAPALAALAGYLAVTLFMARDLLPRLSTSIVGPLDGDNFWFVWSVWSFRRAVLGGQDPNYSDQIRALTAPVPVFTDGFFNQLLAVPLQSFLSALAAYDVTILLSFVLAGLAMHLLASAFTRSWVACFIAGLVFSLSTYHFGRATMHLGLLTLQMLPFCAWRLVLFVRTPSWRNALLAGAATGLVPWADVYYGAYFLVTFGAGLAVAIVLRDRRWPLRPRNLGLAGAAVALAAVVALPAVYAYFLAPADVRAGVAAEAGLASKLSLSADLAGFLLPDPYNPLLGGVFERLFHAQPVFPTRSVFLGYPAMALSLAALLLRGGRTRATFAWLALGVAGGVLALGPELRVVGRWIVPLPAYDLVFGLSVLHNFRAPAVLAAVAQLSISVVAALGAAALLAALARSARQRAAIGTGLVALVLVGLAPSTISAYGIASFDVPQPAVYERIAASPDGGLLLDVPTYIASAQYFQTVHGKPLVGGILPREPARSLTAMDEVPYVWLLNSWLPLPANDTAPVPAGSAPADVIPLPGFAEGLRRHGISWVVLHRFLCADPAVNTPFYCPPFGSYGTSLAFLTSTLGPPFFTGPGGDVVAWHVADAPASAAPDPAFELGPGWRYGLELPSGGEPRRDAVAPAARLFVDAPRAETVRITVRASSLVHPITVRASLDDRPLATVRLGATPVDVDLGTVWLRPGRSVLELRSQDGCVAQSAEDPGCRSFAVQRVSVSG